MLTRDMAGFCFADHELQAFIRPEVSRPSFDTVLGKDGMVYCVGLN
jgi:hypothetical protein